MQCCRFDRLRTYSIFKLLWNWFQFWRIELFSDLRKDRRSFRTWMKSSRSFTMRAFRINVFAFCSLAFFEVSHSQAFSSLIAVQATVSAASGSQLAECDAFDLLRLRMRRQISQTQSKTTERFLNYKCINCNGDFSSLRSYNTHRRHRKAQGTPCSEESSKSEVTFASRANLTTGILRQNSLAKAKRGESFTLPFLYGCNVSEYDNDIK